MALALLDLGRVQAVPIAFVLNSFDPGGTEHQMTEVMCRLNGRMFAVHAACFGPGGVLRQRVEQAGIPIEEFPLRGLASRATATGMLRFARWCRSRQFQVVQACDFYANVFALPAAALARVPVRAGSRRDVLLLERTAGQRRLQVASYRFAHRVVANSAAAVDRLIAEGLPRRKIACIPNGLDAARFAAPTARPGRATVTTVAHLREGKGHDVLLRAAAHVIARIPDARFRIVGDGARRAELEMLAARLGVTARVEFLGHCADVPSVLAQTDVFAFPSLMEASPNAVLEAMAAGVPVAATRVGGIPEIVRHGENGLLVPPGDDRALADAVIRLIEEAGLADRLGAAARQAVTAKFSFDRAAGAFERLYVSELSQRAGAWGLSTPQSTPVK